VGDSLHAMDLHLAEKPLKKPLTGLEMREKEAVT
jgi:hypothetical protein